VLYYANLYLFHYFVWEYNSLFTSFFTPAFSGTQLEHKTRTWCTADIIIFFLFWFCDWVMTPSSIWLCVFVYLHFNPLNAKLNPICHFLALLGAHHILHVSRIRIKGRTSYYIDPAVSNQLANVVF